MEEEKKVLTEDASALAAAPEETQAPDEIKADEQPEAKGKKPLTKGKRIANAIVLGVQIAFVVLAIVICLVVLLNPKEQGEISPLGVKLLYRFADIGGDFVKVIPREYEHMMKLVAELEESGLSHDEAVERAFETREATA